MMRAVFMVVGCSLMLMTAGAFAAEITNSDSKTVNLVIVENGNRSDLPLAPGASETICTGGCFLTAPNGDHIGLSGNETVDISGGVAVVK